MATILFTYEFGAGLGHLNRLLAVAQRLREHRLVFALPDLALGKGVVERALGSDADIVQGVVWPAPTDPGSRSVPTQTFADVIRLFGFQQVEQLGERTDRWRELLRQFRPDLIVSDFAPTLRLEAQGKVPSVVVGNGYTVPPAARLLPPMRPWEREVPARSRLHEGELVVALNRVRADVGGAAVDFIADLFQGDETFVCTLAEFDPYRSVRAAPPLWPFNVPAIDQSAHGSVRDRIFAYFQVGHPGLMSVLGALNTLSCRCEVYVQGADPGAIAARCSQHIGVHRKPADFAAVLPRCSLMVHHAGLGTAYAGLVAGVPQAVLPLNLEHAITTSGLEAFGVVSRVRATPPPDPASLAADLVHILGSESQRNAAERAAVDLQARRDPNSVLKVVEACQALI